MEKKISAIEAWPARVISLTTTILLYINAPSFASTTQYKISSKPSITLGGEFPGATGEINTVQDHLKQAIHTVNFDLTCGGDLKKFSLNQCGKYVGATFRPPSRISINDPILNFEVKQHNGWLRMKVRIKDGTGQILDFLVPSKAPAPTDDSKWEKVAIPVVVSSRFWGGANNGTVSSGISEISILIGDTPYPLKNPSFSLRNLSISNGRALEINIDRLTFEPKNLPHNVLAIAAHSPSGAALDRAKEVGIRVVRVDLFWASVERRGKYDFSRYDTLARELRRRNMKAIWILDYGNPDYDNGTPPTHPLARNAFTNFAKAVATRFGEDVTFAFEVWNEPHLSKYWKNPDPKEYGRLLYETTAAIKTVAPWAKVVASGGSLEDWDFYAQLVRSRPAWAVDAFSIHPYTRGHPERIASDADLLLRSFRENGWNGPVWDTESGYSSREDFSPFSSILGNTHQALKLQADFQLRKVISLKASQLALHTLFSLRDAGVNPSDREHNFGLLDFHDNPKPSWHALRDLYIFTQGKKFLGFATNLPIGWYVAKWETEGSQVYAAWIEGQGDFVVSLRSNGIIRRIERNMPTHNNHTQGSGGLTPSSGVLFFRRTP